ncbi:MAG: tetratricopeptide repeat protein [Rhodospirillales bacterium]|nr:tetratricopeptide repeat protein [Rhodospirillales bacterium]
MPTFRFLLCFIAVFAGVNAAFAAEDAERYAACLRLAEERPVDGWEEALAWQSLGGGEPAKHCGAVALIGLEEHGEAAMRLEGLARESRASAGVRAGMLAQAGQAWLLEGRPERAVAALSAALALRPDDADLLIDRAFAFAQAANYGEALGDLDRALSLAPGRADALTLRASAHRYLDRPDEARRDVDQALFLKPRFPDALVERGILKRLAGDVAGARRDWLATLAAAPDSAAAEAARRNLELMDVDATR